MRWCAVTVLLIFAGLIAGQANQASTANQKHAQAQEVTSAASLGKKDSQNISQDSQAHQAKADADSWEWQTAVKRPEWWAVWLAFPTLIFLIWQTWETHRAVKASRDSIRLQETAFYQWVDLANWRTVRPTTIGHSETLSLHVLVDVINNAFFPVTLNDAQLSL